MDEILNLIESVSEGFPTYSYVQFYTIYNFNISMTVGEDHAILVYIAIHG